MNLFTFGRTTCRWCGKNRGLLTAGPANDPYGILLCPRCDYRHDCNAGPPPSIEHRIRDVDPKP